jgi:DNA-binding transcriptional LysR family regulator
VVGMHPGSAIHNQLVRAAAEAGQPLRLRMQVTSYDALCSMVAAGLGIGLIPRRSALIFRGLAIRLVALDEPWARRRLMLCLRSQEAPGGVARLLVKHLQAGTTP